MDNAEFDAEFYARSYMKGSDAVLPDRALSHYQGRQVLPGVYPTAAACIRHELSDPVLREWAKNIAAEFSWRDYISLNEDLATMTPLQATQHYVSYGIYEPRQVIRKAALLDRRYSLLARLGGRVDLSTPVQVVVHCYHYDVLCKMAGYLRTLARTGAALRLLVANQAISSVALDHFIASLYTGCVDHTWIAVDNHGEDWSSLHYAYDQGLLDSPGITYKLQTKKSTNLGIDGGLAWIDEALQPLCGSYSSTFEVRNRLGPGSAVLAASLLCKRRGFGANVDLLDEYIQRMSLDREKSVNLDFCMGSMFAADNRFLRSFFSRLGRVDYGQVVAGGSQYCGRYPGHALERLIFYYAALEFGVESITWMA